MTTLRMNLGERSYDITVGCGLLERASEYFSLARRVFIVTDDGVPREYEMIQIHACVIGYNMSGAEGQTSHSENGTVRQYAYSDMAAFIHKNVTPYAYIL